MLFTIKVIYYLYQGQIIKAMVGGVWVHIMQMTTVINVLFFNYGLWTYSVYSVPKKYLNTYALLKNV